MSPLIADLIGGALVAAWWGWRPRASLRTLLLLWWLGIACARLLPGIVRIVFTGASGPASPAGMVIADLTGWIGGLLLLRVLTLLALRDRPRSRRLALFAGLFVLAFLIDAAGARTVPLSVILALPFLWSSRWSDGLGRRALGVVTLSALASAMLCAFALRVEGGASLPTAGLDRLRSLASAFALVYAVIVFARLSRRIQYAIPRIGVRLLVSHLLAGLVPLVLASLFLLLASALFLSTYRGTVARRLLLRSVETAEERLANDAPGGPGAPRDDGTRRDRTPFGEAVGGQIVIEQARAGRPAVVSGNLAFDADSLLAVAAPAREVPLLWDGRRLFLRAGRAAGLSDSLRVEALAPVDSLYMAGLSELVGIPVRLNPSMQVIRQRSGIAIDDGSARSTGGQSIGPSPRGRAELPGGAVVLCLVRGPEGWRIEAIPLLSSASLGEPLLALFTISRENPLATAVLLVLAVIAFLMLAGLWLTASTVIGMGRSIANTVGSLREATEALGHGRLDHRIRLEGDDELWNVAASFNQMAEGLERMRAVELESERLEEELRLAREIQQRLLPTAPPVVPGLELAGLSLPARHVGGDYFDYLMIGPERVGLVIADVSGKGVPASLLMSGFRASLRSEDLARLGPGAALGRLNRFVMASVEPGKFITAFLAVLDGGTGELRYANAGHEPAIVVDAAGSIRSLGEGGPILGVLPEVRYAETRAHLAAGARLALFTDGVSEAQSPDERFFGAEGLVRLLQRWPDESCLDLLARIVDEIQRFAAPAAPADDITMVLARRR